MPGDVKCIKCKDLAPKEDFEILPSGALSRTCNGCKGLRKSKKIQREDDCDKDISDDQQKAKELLERAW